MSSDKFTIALEILAKNGVLMAALQQSQGGVKRFAEHTKREFDSLRSVWSRTMTTLGVVGGGLGTAKLLQDSAKLDVVLTRIRQMAGATVADQQKLRQQLFDMSKMSGQSVNDLVEGFNNLIAAGQSWDQASSTIDGINVSMAVTGASAGTLAGALTVAATAFQFDLSQPGQALGLLDRMVVAGRLGNAELEALSDVFSRLGVNAKTAGMSFEQTLGFVETLSMIERQPERLANLADSTIRLFTNARYARQAEAATKVKFFDPAGARRNAAVVIGELKAAYDKLGTEEQRSKFIQRAFGHADLDTIKGLRTLFSGSSLSQWQEFSDTISKAGGTQMRDLPANLSNADTQAKRLGNTLRNAADDFSAGINRGVTKAIGFVLDKQNMNGAEIVGAGALGLTAAWGLGKMAGGWAGNALSKLAGRFGATATGIAEGKAVEAATGVTPVFVTNWPGAFGPASVPGKPGVPTIPGAPRIPGTAGAGGVFAAGVTAPLTAAAMAGLGIYGASKASRDYVEERTGIRPGIFEWAPERRLQRQSASGREPSPEELLNRLTAPKIDLRVNVQKDGSVDVKATHPTGELVIYQPTNN